MTSESERGSSDPSDSNEATPRLKSTQEKPIQEEEGPEALRGRADSLLDEMMLGAVDVSAADTRSTVPAEKSTGTSGAAPSSDADFGGYVAGANEMDFRQPGNGNYASSDTEPYTFSSKRNASDAIDRAQSQHSEPQSAVEVSQRQNGYEAEAASPQPTPTPEWRVKSGSGSSRSDDSVWNDYVDSFRAPGDVGAQIPKWQSDSPADGNERSIYGSTDAGAAASDSSQAGGAHPPEPSSGERSDDRDGGYVSAMAVMSRGPRRSSLLPRMSRFDVDALDREIAGLHEEIRVLLPVGHDQAERALHLLDKANTIAQSDPERSAEVEYYMQQVRTIVERTRQARKWSNLYRDRLRIYLLAWTLLSALVLTALLLFQFQIEAYVVVAMDVIEDGLLMRNLAGALGSMMAGALGGALGALLNMRKHTRTQYGFFDRKYGLRGLMLPIIGALVGLIVFSVFATVYYFAGINPSLSAVAMALPALIAFFFGFSQESIYGTSG